MARRESYVDSRTYAAAATCVCGTRGDLRPGTELALCVCLSDRSGTSIETNREEAFLHEVRRATGTASRGARFPPMPGGGADSPRTGQDHVRFGARGGWGRGAAREAVRRPEQVVLPRGRHAAALRAARSAAAPGVGGSRAAPLPRGRCECRLAGASRGGTKLMWWDATRAASDRSPVAHTPISSFHNSGFRSMNSRISATQVSSSTISSTTPRERT